MMKRIVAVLFLLAILLVALALVAPGFIDWNKHKDIIIPRIEAAIDRKIDVAGAVSFRILPNPHILLQDVSIAAAEGAKNPFLTLRQMEAKMRLRPLLEGRLEVESFHLTAPSLTLEMLQDGTPAWETTGAAKEKGSGFTAIALQSVTVTDGKIRYIPQGAEAEIVLDKLNLAIQAARLEGPYTIKGDLRYRDTPVNVEVTTQPQNTAGLYPVNVLLQPLDVLPQIRFDGAAALARGLVLVGDVHLSQGRLGALLDDDFSKTASFMTDVMDVSGALTLKDQSLSLKIETGKLGGKGTFSGTLETAETKHGKPRLTVDIVADQVALSEKSGAFLPTPTAFDLDAKVKAKNILWQGMRFPGVTLDAKTQNDEWHVQSARLDLDGKDALVLSGTITPQQQMASWKVTLRSQNMGQSMRYLPSDVRPFLKALGHRDLSIPLHLTGNLDQRPKRTSLYNFDARVGDGHVAGVLNLQEGAAIQARVNVAGFDIANFSAPLRTALASALVTQRADLEVNATDISFKTIAMPKVSLKTKGADKGLSIVEFQGDITAKDSFSLTGIIPSWPLSETDFQLSYALKTGQTKEIADMLGVTFPAPLQTARNFDVTGEWKRDAVGYTVTAKGGFHGGDLDMTAVKAAQDAAGVWKSDMKINVPESALLFSTFGLPHDYLFLPRGAVAMTATVAGAEDAFKLSATTQAESKQGMTAEISRNAEGLITSDVKSDFVDMNRWFAFPKLVEQENDLRLTAKKLRWRDITVAQARADILAKPAELEVRKLSGTLWGGGLDVSGTAKLADKKWNGRLTGTLKSADFAPLMTLAGLKGIALGGGDAVFDLSGPGDAKELEQSKGTIALTLESVTLDAFDPAALAAFVAAEKSLPNDLAVKLHKTMRENGSATFKDVALNLNIADNKATIETLSLDNADCVMQVTGSLDLAAGTYDIKAEMTLKNLPDVGGITITRKGGAADAPDYRLDIAGIKNWIESQMPPPVPEPVPVEEMDITAPDMPDMIVPDMPDAAIGDVEAEPLAAPPTVVEDVQTPDAPDTQNALQGILDRLEEDTQPALTETEILPVE